LGIGQVDAMTYDPHGQQPYGPYQQPYDSYQQQYQQDPYQQYGTYDPQKVPIKGPSFGKVIGVIFVIIILIVVISSGVFVYYMNQAYAPDGDIPDLPPQATLVVSNHDNPKADMTVNGGYWSARVTALSGNKPYLYDVTVATQSGDVTMTSWTPVTKSTVDCMQCQPPWYLKGHDPVPLFVDGSDLTSLTFNTASQVGPNEFGTIQGAHMLYIDNDGDSKMSPDDAILVFRDPDGDGTDEVSSGDNLAISTSKGTVARAKLY
jgi:hypothetical protein